jgi:hypothetical protein
MVQRTAKEDSIHNSYNGSVSFLSPFKTINNGTPVSDIYIALAETF